MRTFLHRSLTISIFSLVFLTSCTDEPKEAVSPSAPTQTGGPTVSSQESPPGEARAFACEPRDLTFDQGAIDLTGAWSADDSAVYYLRQIGNVLWWQGMSGVGVNEESLGKDFDNVLRGTIGRDLLIEADWADVPRGVISGKGTLTLQVVEGNDGMAKIRKLDETGTGFGGRVWTPCAPTSP